MDIAKPMKQEMLNKEHSEERQMRILFISPRPFGLMGTPGTYLLTASYGEFADICIVSNKKKKKNSPIVYRPKNHINHHEIDFGGIKFYHEIECIVEEFIPHLIILGNYTRWFNIVSHLKQKFADLIYVLDIKSPLIVEEDEILYQQIQDQGIKTSHLLNLVMTRCVEDVETWIPGCREQILTYPLGIKIEDYAAKDIQDNRIQCRRFVYVGSIHPRRKIDQMIAYISKLPSTIKNSLVFDFYGSGPAIKDLVRLSKELGLEKIITFKGCLDTQSLARVLTDYDAGVAWVPYEVYNAAPSLKLLEYLAAGLIPLAMDTKAHKVYGETGFNIQFFQDSAESFAKAVQALYNPGFLQHHRKENLEKIKAYDWHIIASKIILPVFSELIDTKPETDGYSIGNLHDRVCLWNIPCSPEKPHQIFKSKIRIASILSEKRYQGLDLDCDLLLLTPQNWKSVLAHTQPDFLLVESTWITATDHWYMAQSIPGAANDEIQKIILSAKKRGIPTVFWMTMDRTYYQHFNQFAKGFDFVFCADSHCTKYFIKEGVTAKTLLPAVQPALFNPIHRQESKSFHAGILYDGWVDLFRSPELGRILKKLKGCNLNIFQTELMMYKAQLQRMNDELMLLVQGTVMDLMLPSLLKNADLYLSFDKGHKTKTQKAWDFLEATASRLPVAHMGALATDDPLNKFVHQFQDETSFCDFVMNQGGIDIELERDKTRAWRETVLNHVFAKRIQTICNEIGVTYDWEEYPMASLVTGTIRPELLSRCFERFEAQTYPNKELILIFNGDSRYITAYQEKYADHPNIYITHIPYGSTVGTILNYGIHKARGKYFFRMDDDDTYGPNYVLDMVLYHRAVNADIFGKRASFYHFEGEKEIYLRNRSLPGIKTFPARLLHKNQDYQISGCSFAASVDLLRKYRFPDHVHASVDTAFIEKIVDQGLDVTCLLVDNMNLVVERASNVSDHTWRIDADEIKKTSMVVADDFKEVIC